MHFSIPDTQELYSESTGTTYTGYNIYINGAYHCCLRYKQLHALHEDLQRLCLQLGGDICLPLFPPKRLLPLTNGQLERRRAALEHYLQIVGQEARLAKSEMMQKFLLTAQLDTAAAEGALDRYGGGGGYVTMEVLLMNNYSVPVTGRVSDNASTLLQKVTQCLKLPISLVQYFCLFLAKSTKVMDNENLRLLRHLMDFESPFISRLHADTPPCHIVLRTSHWNPAHDLQLASNELSLNLLFLQTVADVEREWIIATPSVRQKLRALQLHGLKKEYLELARELPLYACLQFEASHVDYPDIQTKIDESTCGNVLTAAATVLVSIGNKELSIRMARGAKIYETKFRVTRMRCWRVTAVHSADANTGIMSYEPQAQLSFEYLMSKHVLRWITITSCQAMLMSVCLQAMVDELIIQQNKIKGIKDKIPTTTSKINGETSIKAANTIPASSSMPTISANNSRENLHLSSASTSSSPTAPIKFLAHRHSLKNNPKVYASTYAAVFFCKDLAQQDSTMHNDAYQGIGDDEL